MTWLPVDPLRRVVDEFIARNSHVERHLRVSDFGTNGLTELAMRCAQLDPAEVNHDAWVRKLYRLRVDGLVVSLDVADVVLLAIGDGTCLDDVWPDWDAAVAEGYRLRHPLMEGAA